VRSTGTRVGNECFDSLPASAKLRPLRDQIILDPMPWQFSNKLGKQPKKRASEALADYKRKAK
jgi:hypothetical protein